MFAADFAAAFDSIDFCILFQVLSKFGFDEQFLRWIRLLHNNNSKSFIMNGGYSTCYFPLKRGTRQGDPLAPYLFLLLIEILIAMVRQNKNILGIEINGHEFKQCVFADDTTCFLHDLDSLSELKKTLTEISKMTSLCVNYQKSEIAWIGSAKKWKLPELGINTLDLNTEALRILGIHFTYNKTLSKQLNFDRVLNNLKSVINIWRGRTLSLYEKTLILKSLAIPKKLYVCSMFEVPYEFTGEVKKILCKFLWNSTPKIKYGVLIDNLENGGIKFIDFKTLLAAQRVMWIKRIIAAKGNQWKIIPSQYLFPFGGNKTIGNNSVIKQNVGKLPPFYKSCLQSWSGFTRNDPQTVTEILLQHLWNNRFLSAKFPSDFISLMVKHKVIIIKDVYKSDGKLQKFSDIIPMDSNNYNKYYIQWLSLTKNIPKNWKNCINDEPKSNLLLLFNNLSNNMIVVDDMVKQIHSLDSKFIYTVIVKKQCEHPTKRLFYENKYGNNFNWHEVCSNIYKTSVNHLSRVFQLKIVHDILPTNYKLYRWKVKDSPRCSYCFTENETLEHLFSECHVAITLYSRITEWALKCGIVLPKLDSTTLFGITSWSIDNALLNHILLLYKETIFNNRESGKYSNLMSKFIRMIDNVFKLESVITKNKPNTHEQKWKKYILFCQR